ncbi:hypothetical protein [Staphylococcus phage vB_SurM-PSU4]|nr:hypothetical protein [Staphylococcus phage vB_SurM-PSU4]
MTVAFMFLIALFVFQLVYSFLSIKEAKNGNEITSSMYLTQSVVCMVGVLIIGSMITLLS